MNFNAFIFVLHVKISTISKKYHSTIAFCAIAFITFDRMIESKVCLIKKGPHSSTSQGDFYLSELESSSHKIESETMGFAKAS